MKSSNVFLALAISLATHAAGVVLPSSLSAGVIYEKVLIPDKGSLQTSYSPNKTSLYTILSLDTEDGVSDVDGDDAAGGGGLISDPKVYIRTKQGGDQQQQYCGTYGSKVCILKKALTNTQIDILIKCMKQCQFTLKITNVAGLGSVAKLTDFQGSPKVYQQADPRGFYLYSVEVPALQVNPSLEALMITVSSSLTTKSLVEVYSSYMGDDLGVTMDTARPGGFPATESGMVLKYSLIPETNSTTRAPEPIYGFCYRGCTVYVAVRNRNPSRITIATRLVYRENKLLKNTQSSVQVILPREQQQDNPMVMDRSSQCWPFKVESSIFNIRYSISILSGDPLGWTAYHRSNDGSFQELLIRSGEPQTSHVILVKSADRWRNSEPPTNNLVYLCATTRVSVMTSLSIATLAADNQQRYTLQDDTLATFMLSNKEYVYFVYSNEYLAQEVMNLTLTVTISTTLFRQSIPRLLYRVCAYSEPENCNLNDVQPWNPFQMTLLPGTFDDYTKTRVAIINHKPSVCPFEYVTCSYMFTVYNPDPYGPMRVTFKVQNSRPEGIIQLGLYQSYRSQVPMNKYHYFQVELTASQLYGDAFPTLPVRVTLTTFNGRADLFVSNRTQYPSISTADRFSSSSGGGLSAFLDIKIEKDVSPQLWFSVLGSSSLASSELRLEPSSPIPTGLLEQWLPKRPATASTTQLNENQTTVVLVSDDKLRGGFNPYANLTSTKPNATFYYTVASSGQAQSIIFAPVVVEKNGLIVYNLTMLGVASNSQVLLRRNLSSPTVLRRDEAQFEASTVFRLDIRMLTSKVDQAKNQSIRVTFKVLELNSAPSSLGAPQDLVANRGLEQYSAGGTINQTVVFRKLMLDSGATFSFKLTTLGLFSANQSLNPSPPQIMIFIGSSLTKAVRVKDESSYHYTQLGSDIMGDSVSLEVDPQMRRNVNPTCSNGSYALQGGFDSCTMYVGVQCDQLCAFNLSVTLIPDKIVTKGPIPQEPELFAEGSTFTGTLNRAAVRYYYLPFIGGSNNNNNLTASTKDMVFALDKVNNDAFLVGRIITNGYISYTTWNYPTSPSNDFISQSFLGTNEVVELTQTVLSQRCPTGSSCVLILGVFGNAPQNQSSSYRLTFLNSVQRLASNQLIQRQIPKADSYDYFWFLVTTRQRTDKVRWSQLLSATTALPFKGNTTRVSSSNDVDLYVKVFGSSSQAGGESLYPSKTDYDYKGDSFGPDTLNITSEDKVLQPASKAFKVLFFLGVHAPQGGETAYSLLTWGPTDFNESVLNMQDVQLNAQGTVKLEQKMQYKMFRFMSFGTRDLRFQVSASGDGGVYLLVNRQLLRPSYNQSDQCADAINGGRLQTKENPYLNFPLFNETSWLPPVFIKSGTNYTLEISWDLSQGSIWCHFCYYYIAVFQAAAPVTPVTPTQVNSVLSRSYYYFALSQSAPPKATTQVSVLVSQIANPALSIPLVTANKQQSFIYIEFPGGVGQRRISFETLDPFILNVTERNGEKITVYLSTTPDSYTNNCLWNKTGFGSQLLNMRGLPSETRQYLINFNYYLTVVASRGQSNVSVSLWQEKPVGVLRNTSIYTDRLRHRDDLIKYYLVVPPPTNLFNYTVYLSVRAKTAGFVPLIYTARNDVLNSTFAFDQLRYPSPLTFNNKIERSVFQARNQTTNFEVSITTTEAAVGGQQKVSNQTYHTLALYWVNYGLTDATETEYSIFVSTQKLDPIFLE